jgi:hypothetical protein
MPILKWHLQRRRTPVDHRGVGQRPLPVSPPTRLAGATTGYGLLWMAVLTMPLLVAAQSMAARIGAVKEEGLGQVIEDRFGRRWLIASIVVLVVANTATIAADLGGVAAGGPVEQSKRHGHDPAWSVTKPNWQLTGHVQSSGTVQGPRWLTRR